MFCDKCGAEIKNGVKFCQSCGAPSGWKTPVTRPGRIFKKGVARYVVAALCIAAAAAAALSLLGTGTDVWDGSAEPFDTSVAGDSEHPYVIDTAEKLAYLAESVREGNNYSRKYFKLTKDLNLKKIPWTPIGCFAENDESSDLCFMGIFNGEGHTISNLRIAKSDAYIGLFGAVGGGA
jgi:hypothetical protein